MEGDEREWGIRLADARIPSWWGVGVLVLALAALYRSLRDRKEWASAASQWTEAIRLLGERMKQGDQRDARVAELTQRMESYGRMSVGLARASLAVAVVALVVALVAALT